MDLDTIKQTFEKVAEKQKQSTTRSEEVIDQLINELEVSISKLQDLNSDQSSIVTDLKTRITEISPLSQLESSQKDINLVIAKYLKLLEKTFTTDISKSYRKNIDMDIETINEIIACHFYRQGQFELGDNFSESAHVANSDSLKAPFSEMHSIIQSIKSHDLLPAITWASQNREKLSQTNSENLELKLHKFQFISILKTGNRDSALEYARTNLSPFASEHKTEIQKLIALLLWTNRLDQSPYATSLTPTRYADLADDVARQYCSLLNQSFTSPLEVVVSAGAEGLPTLIKLANVMAASKKEEWNEMKQLPVPLDLPKEYQYHSVFVCPVLREQGGEENPPMLMPCGHVLSRQSIVKLSKNSTRGFKCPYCPVEASVSQCRQLHF